jgi:DnaJ-domain-containing protein 1/cbb3-type cytochrome oxidase subunit 3
MYYELFGLNMTFFLVFFFTIVFIFYFYLFSRKKKSVFPSSTSGWSFWLAHATPAVRKEFVASRTHAFRATLSEMESHLSERKMRLSLQNLSEEEFMLYVEVISSLGCQVSSFEKTTLLTGNGSSEIVFDVRILSGRQSITVNITSESGELLFTQTHIFALPASNVKSHLGILGLSEGATKSEIKRRRRQLAKKFHPDKGATRNEREVMLEKMKEINRAYAALKEMGYV